MSVSMNESLSMSMNACVAAVVDEWGGGVLSILRGRWCLFELSVTVSNVGGLSQHNNHEKVISMT